MNTAEIVSFYQKSFQMLDLEFIQILAEHSIEEVIKKGKIVHNAGDRYDSLSFLVDGLLRGYYLDCKGADVTDCFGFEPGTPVMSSVALDEPAIIVIEALEDSRVLTVSCKVLMDLLKTDINAVNLYNKILQRFTEKHWKTKSALVQYDAKARYLWFLKNYPGLIYRTNHKYIASFLGMTSVSLSRIRHELGETKHV